MAQRVLHVDCPVIGQTPVQADHLFGFNDICPWSPDGDALAILRLPESVNRIPNGNDIAELCIWNPASNTVQPIAETRAWNYQQGARQRWLDGGLLLVNDVIEGRERAIILSRSGAVVRTLPRATYALSPDERLGISPSFGRLAVHHPPGYGYVGAQAPSVGHPKPEDDGVWATDMATGESRLLVSLARLAHEAQLPDHMIHFVSHMRFNFAGSEMLFLHGATTADGGVFGRLMVMGQDGSGLRCVAQDKVSHPCWIDDQALVVWTRRSRLIAGARTNPIFLHPAFRALANVFRNWQGKVRNKLLQEGLTLIRTDGRGAPAILGSDSIREDGHFWRHPRLPVIVGDTYPDGDGRLHLFLYDLETGTKVEMRSFYHGVRWSAEELRSDLHPRWNRSGTQVAVDVSQEGVRRVVLVDAEPALAALGRS